ncbi:MAG: YheU family protein [Deltaproteobacteria bacterium]|nr:YheU family protein [Deltaproteobacteria bacterium]
MIVPPNALLPDVLTRLLEEYITREGTFVGEGDEASLPEDVAHLKTQLKKGEICITYDEETETVSLVSKEDAVRFEEPYSS